MADLTTPEILLNDKFDEVFSPGSNAGVYDIRRKEYFKSKDMEEASNACNGKHHIYYFIEYRRVNKLCGEFEAN